MEFLGSEVVSVPDLPHLRQVLFFDRGSQQVRDYIAQRTDLSDYLVEQVAALLAPEGGRAFGCTSDEATA